MKKVKITSICEIQVGKTPSRSNPSYWSDGSLWLSIADMNQGTILETTKETITEKAIRECNCKIVPHNTVLFSFKLSIGKVGITKVPMYTNEAIAAFIIKDQSKLDTKFLFYVLKSVDHSIGSNKAVMGKTLNKEKLKKIEITLPPIEDQKRIVTILNQADALRQKRKQTITFLDDYLKSMFLEMFGKFDYSTFTLESLALKDRGTFSNGPFGSDLLCSELVEEGVPVVYIRDIRNGSYKWKSNVYVTLEKAQSLSACQIKKGDLLITKVGDPPGTAAIYPNDELAIMTQDVIRLRTSNIVNNIYLQHWFNSNLGERALKGIIIQGTRMRFSLKELKKLKVPIPSIELQDKFAETVEKVELLKIKMLDQSEEFEDQFQALMQKAFKGAL